MGTEAQPTLLLTMFGFCHAMSFHAGYFPLLKFSFPGFSLSSFKVLTF